MNCGSRQRGEAVWIRYSVEMVETERARPRVNACRAIEERER